MGRRRVAALAISLIWLTTAAVTLFIAAETAVGPVLVRFTHTHGVHLGDVVGGGVVSWWAGIATIELLRWSRR